MNQLNFKDYAPYYIGCKCFNTWFPKGADMYDNDWVLKGYHAGYPKPYCLDNKEEETWTDSIKPILRKLWDMTDEDCWQIDKLDSMWVPNTSTEYKTNRLYLYREKCIVFRDVSPLVFDYLLKQGFDLFKLIENGLAIDSKTLK
jgi:hypothetical protein